MANVLGLSFYYHDSAAALVQSGHVVAAAAEERFCRRKHTNEFPRLAIEYCLETGGFRSINELDAIVFYEKPAVKLQRVVESLVSVWPKGIGAFTRELPSYLAGKFNVYRVIEQALPGYSGDILFAEHHRSHAASAFLCSPFDEAAILTMDGVGEWATTAIGHGKGSTIALDREIRFPHSIGLLYSALTGYLGFRVNDGEWKVMGLAPYGTPRYADAFRKLVDTRPDGSFRLRLEYFEHQFYGKWMANTPRWESLFGLPPRDPGAPLTKEHHDLACSGQAFAEELILNLAREARRASGSKNLVIAGGVGLNSVANWRIEREGVFDNVWIQPAAGDDGAAIGAALLTATEVYKDPRCPELTNVYLGPAFTDREIAGFLDTHEIPYQNLNDDDLVNEVSQMLAAGKVIGWFQGRMEFGPRSLGARSILADPRNPQIRDLVNAKVKFRESFRPFAPAVQFERASEYFEMAPEASMPFMLKVPQVRPEKREVIPAVTHVDGTARVQTVREADNPLFYKLLAAFGQRTGVPVLLNTSFNVRGEPIVCSPKDAVSCFFNSGIDALVLGHYVVTDKPTTEIDISAQQFQRSDALEAGIEENARGGAAAPLVAQPFTLEATSILVPTAPASLAEAPRIDNAEETTRKVLNFYREMPFNYYSNSLDIAKELQRSNRIKEYTVVHRHLKSAPGSSLLDVGCGAGWFVNSCGHYYSAKATGLDLNPVVLKQARAVARLMPGCEENQFVEGSVFEYEPGRSFDVVNSLGVLHSTPDCHGAIRRAISWIAPRGYFHLGLYHLYGRRPFLQHFADLQEQGHSDAELFEEFKRLTPDITDETHLMSWFRDQVLHPHETQHTYEEIEPLLAENGLRVLSVSFNGFRKLPSHDEVIAMERHCEEISRVALQRHRYYPGFFSVWAQRT